MSCAFTFVNHATNLRGRGDFVWPGQHRRCHPMRSYPLASAYPPTARDRAFALLRYLTVQPSHRTAVGVSANTVREMRRILRKSDTFGAYFHSLDDDAWYAVLGTGNKSIAQRKRAPDWDRLDAEMQRPDATLEQLWREWRSQCPEGIAYSQFTAGYRAWAKRQHIVMRQAHRPGEKLFVDFAGRTVEMRDRSGGPSIYAQIFVAVLGYFNLTYLQAVAWQKTPDWVRCHVDCFAAMGGVPAGVVPDNLKAAVWRREKGSRRYQPGLPGVPAALQHRCTTSSCQEGERQGEGRGRCADRTALGVVRTSRPNIL